MESACRNQLVVGGPSDELDQFVADARTWETPLLFASLRPVPPDPREEEPHLDPLVLMQVVRSIPSENTILGWKLANWSTFSDAQEARVSRDIDGAMRYDFYSDPPIALIRWLAQTRPALRFHLSWYDPNARYAGQLLVGDGRDVLHEANTTATMLDALAGSPLESEVREFFDEMELWDEEEMEPSEA